MPSLRQLQAQSPLYDSAQTKKLRLLYTGGYDLQKEARIFLPMSKLEGSIGYEERLRAAAYVPILSQCIDTFVSLLFVKELTINQNADAANKETLGNGITDKDFYKLFASDCDRRGNSLHNFCRNLLTAALTVGFAYVGVDMPLNNSDAPINLLEESSRGLDRCYLYCIDTDSLINWKMDSSGEKFQWVILRNCETLQDTPLSPVLKRESFRVWSMRGEFAQWQLFQTKAIPVNEQFDPTDNVPIVDEGITSFREIPILKLRVPDGLNVGNRIGPLCEEHFQRRSWQVSASNKACVISPVFTLGDEYSEEGSITADPGRATNYRQKLEQNGALVLNKGETFSFQEPDGKSLSFLAEQIKNIEHTISTVVQQMASSSSVNHNVMSRSAASKQADRFATEVILSAYARITKDFVKELLNCVASGRKEAIVWSIDGLSTESKEETDDIVARVQMAPLLIDLLPSPSFQITFASQLSSAILGPINPELEQQISEELQQSINQRSLQHQDEQQLLNSADSLDEDDSEE